MAGLRGRLAPSERLGTCREGGYSVPTAQDCANLALAAAAILSCLRRLSEGLELAAEERWEKHRAHGADARETRISAAGSVNGVKTAVSYMVLFVVTVRVFEFVRQQGAVKMS